MIGLLKLDLYILILCVVNLCNGQNSTTQSVSAETSAVTKLADPIDKALQPLFTMTDGFLHAVFPKGISVETIDKVIDILNSSYPSSEIWPVTQTIIREYAGFAACIVIGLILIIVIPVIGLCCCICRSCNRCGGQTQEYDPKHAKFKKVVVAVLLFLMTLAVLAGMVMLFFSASRWYIVTKDNFWFVEINRKLSAVDDSVNKTIGQDIVGQVKSGFDGIQTTVSKFVDSSGYAVAGNILSLVSVDQPMKDLIRGIAEFNETLGNMIVSLESWQQVKNETVANYTMAQHYTTNLTCTGCQQVNDSIANILSSLNSVDAQKVINEIKDSQTNRLNKIPNLSVAYSQVNETISKEVLEKINSSKQDILSMVDKARTDIFRQLDVQTDELFSAFGLVSDSINITHILAKFDLGNYWWYGNIAIGSVIAFIIFLYMLGILYGCGERPGPDAPCCNKGCGAKFLLSGVGVTFILFAILMIVTVIMFTFGSLATSHFCWTLQQPQSVSAAFSGSNLDQRVSGNITISRILNSYSKCLNKEPIGKLIDSLNIKGFEKQTLLDMLNASISADKLKPMLDKVNISTDRFTDAVLSSSVNASLREISQYTGFNNTALQNSSKELEQIHTDLTEYLPDLGILIASAENEGKTADAINLGKIRDVVQMSVDSGLPRMKAIWANVNSSMVSLDSSLTNLQNASRKLLTTISHAQNEIQVNGTQLIKQTVLDLANQLMAAISDRASVALDKVFATKCDGIAEAIKETVDVPCQQALKPFNGLWFSLGWCLIVLILCLMLALVLSSYFRREYPYEYHKDDLNSHYADNIQLESRSKPYNNGELTNMAFRDDYGRATYDSDGNDNSYYRQPPRYY